MSFGLQLFDPDGFMFYSSDDGDFESILIFDSFTLSTEDSGYKVYADLKGGAAENMRWMLFPRNDLVRNHYLYRSGNTLHWQKPEGGSPGLTDVVVTIK